MKCQSDPRLALSRHILSTLLALLLSLGSAPAQQPTAQTVPHLVTFSGTAVDSSGRVHAGLSGITFALYREQDGGAPLWLETQNVQVDTKGHYTVQIGVSKAEGVPLDLFVSGEARWLGVHPEGQPEQPRVLLVSVPYALKAADADTIGGRPATAFVLAPTPGAATEGATSSGAPLPPAPAGSGTVNFVPLWSPDGSTLGNSVLFQSGSGATAKLGVNTTTPASTLDVKGGATVRGVLSLPITAPATAAAGKTSQALNFTASSFKSGGAAVNQTFQWKAEPAGNNTASPSGTLNLLFGSGATAPAETGLKVASNGILTFAPGQTFPGGAGSVSSVALTAPASDFVVTGSPITSAGTLGLMWTIAPTDAPTPNAIVKRDSLGGFYGNNVSVNGKLAAGGPAVFGGTVGIGTSTPQATLNINVNGFAKNDTFLIGNNTARGLQLRDTGSFADLESIGVPLCVNCATAQPTYFGNLIGIGTTNPQALLNLNFLGGANSDTLLLGNSTTKGLQLRDNGTGVDIESIGVPLNLNFNTHQPISLNPNGGQVLIGTTVSRGYGLEVAGGFGEIGDVSLSGGFILTGGDAYFNQNLQVSGTKNFRIDHPLDPANKYLKHAAIESSEVLNMYSGNVGLDDKGEAGVNLPSWFEAINTDYRYQLTGIGAPGSSLYVAKEIENGTFRIAGGVPGMKVSWLVISLRNDAYMKAHPFQVEEDKPVTEVGYYGHPEFYGEPPSKGIGSPEHSAVVQKLRAASEPGNPK